MTDLRDHGGPLPQLGGTSVYKNYSSQQTFRSPKRKPCVRVFLSIDRAYTVKFSITFNGRLEPGRTDTYSHLLGEFVRVCFSSLFLPLPSACFGFRGRLLAVVLYLIACSPAPAELHAESWRTCADRWSAPPRQKDATHAP